MLVTSSKRFGETSSKKVFRKAGLANISHSTLQLWQMLLCLVITWIRLNKPLPQRWKRHKDRHTFTSDFAPCWSTIAARPGSMPLHTAFVIRQANTLDRWQTHQAFLVKVHVSLPFREACRGMRTSGGFVPVIFLNRHHWDKIIDTELFQSLLIIILPKESSIFFILLVIFTNLVHSVLISWYFTGIWRIAYNGSWCLSCWKKNKEGIKPQPPPNMIQFQTGYAFNNPLKLHGLLDPMASKWYPNMAQCNSTPSKPCSSPIIVHSDASDPWSESSSKWLLTFSYPIKIVANLDRSEPLRRSKHLTFRYGLSLAICKCKMASFPASWNLMHMTHGGFLLVFPNFQSGTPSAPRTMFLFTKSWVASCPVLGFIKMKRW